MRDHTIFGIQRRSTMDTQDRRQESRYMCNMDHCEADASERVGIALCERHLQKAWAAYQIVAGAKVPEVQPDPERDIHSIEARGTVYVIRVGELIKIGWTSRPLARLTELKADAVLHYKAGTRRDEYKLQGQCMDHLVKGREWFDTSPAMIKFVKDLRLGKIAA